MTELPAGATVGTALRWGRDLLWRARVDTPRLDTELLLAGACGVGRERLLLDRDVVLDADTAHRFAGLVGRRQAREPVAYILGRRAFRHLSLAVDPRVLIPRPETELLVEVGLELADGTVVVDVGTGSGAVALALKHERPELTVLATDISGDALEVARANAARLDLEVEFVEADLLEGVRDGAVLSNLPYVPEGAELAPEIANYEPGLALFAGADGLDLVRALIGAADPGAVPLLALEIGPEQAGEVALLMRGRGYAAVEVRRDLAGLERVVVGRR